MKIEVTEVRWVDQLAECSLHELAELSRLPEVELRELVELGVLQPREPSTATPPGHEPRFDAECLVKIRSVRRLREDFELDAHGASVALALLERVEYLERQLRALRARLSDPST
jgi:chaperone modulatory protein CbpM